LGFGREPAERIDRSVEVADYLPVLVHLLVSVGLATALMSLHRVVAGRFPNPDKQMAYESGVWPVGTAEVRVPIHYYVIAMIFLLFDVEVVFLFPWAVLFRELGWTALTPVLVFLGMLIFADLYAWKRGAFQWQE
jgi:NADH-quinone oxidoreductase subunit A